MARRGAHDPRVVVSKPKLATFQENIFEQVLLPQIVPFSTQEYKCVLGP